MEAPMTDEQRRILSYLQAQGAKLSPAEVIGKVQAAMAELRAAALAVPPARFTERPAPEEWSANEVMAHVLSAGQHFGDRILRALDGAPAVPRTVAEAAAPTRSASEWCDRLARDREALFARALAADPGAHLDRLIEHGVFGRLNWRETLLFLRLHDLDHARQLAAIAAALS
jgi:hypothetical protein